jgi:hypothetical protein
MEKTLDPELMQGPPDLEELQERNADARMARPEITDESPTRSP